MRIREIMSPTVDSIDAGNSIAYAAQRMADDDVGILPVLERDKLVGVVTDRDIAVRGMAAGLNPSTPVRSVMSRSIATCSPDDDVGSVLALMAREQVRRMPVCDSQQNVVGIVGLTDAAKLNPFRKEVADTLMDICESSGVHCHASALA